jgi:hypothetical protein
MDDKRCHGSIQYSIEMTNVNEIQSVLRRMGELLVLSGLDHWANAITHLVSKADEGYAVVRPEIRRMYGGMGSLNDIVLYKDGHVLASENDEFDALRERLYELTRN